MHQKKIKIKKMKFFDTFKVLSMHKKRSKHMKEIFSPFVLKNSLIFISSYLTNKITAYIALDNGKVIGLAYVTHFREYNLEIVVSENYQNKGIGKNIMKFLLKDKNLKNKEINLTTHEENKIALNMYKKLGFEIIGKTLRMKKQPDKQ